MIYEMVQWIIIVALIIWLCTLYRLRNNDINFLNDRISYVFQDIQNIDRNNGIKKLIKVVKTNSNAKLPYKGSENAAGHDLYALLKNKDSELIIPPHETAKIGTGLKIAIPEGYMGLIYARSGLATKEGLAPANKVGVVDADYRGEIIVALHNHTNEEKYIKYGDRIAQLIITPYEDCIFCETDELNETERGSGGFGSSGIN